MSNFTRATIAAALLSVITIMGFLSLPSTIWAEWRPATCLQYGCFCETANTSSPIRQTANTLSSLAYVFSGALAMARVTRSQRFTFGYSIIFGFSSMIIGVGSAFYHASLTFAGQFLDVLGMFMLATFMLVYAFERIWTLRFTTSIGLFLTINLFLGGLQFAIPDTRRYAFAIVLIIALLFEAFYRKQNKPNITTNKLHLGISLLALAYIIWILDNTRTLCIETSLLQGHALWHLLGAVSVWFLYEYYASEKK
jgi:hypothetical protein